MGARWLQQKLLKQKRMRRAYLKKFSTKSTGVTKNFGYFNEQGQYIDNSFRARNIAAKGVMWLDVALLKLLQHDPDYLKDEAGSVYARSGGIHADLVPNVQLYRTVQSRQGQASLQGEEKLVHYNVNDSSFKELRLYMGREICFFIGHRIVDGKNVLYGSLAYADRERALALHRQGKVTWVNRKEVDLSPPSKD